jgi:hypothetical protein
MRPPACVSCKWGQGTTCEKPTSSASSKEVKSKLEEMMSERAKQDAAWFAPPTIKSTDDYTIQSSSSSTTPQNKRK